MRILFATDHIHFPQGGGGAERNTHELCLALRREGVTPAVMCSLAPDNSILALANRFRRKLPPKQQFVRDGFAGYDSFRGWGDNGPSEILNRFRPDFVIVQSTKPAALIDRFTTLGARVLAYFHEVEEVEHLKWLRGKVPILSNSEFTARRLKSRCGLESQVLLPLVEPSFYKVSTSRERVLFVNTVARKGLDIAIALAKARPDIQFDFVRSWIVRGEQLQALRRDTDRLGNVTLHRPTSDMRPLYRRARVLLVPSQWEETWGRVVTEAHISGIPVLASDRGGLPQSVGPGGRLIPFDAPRQKWKHALSELWDDEIIFEEVACAARLYSERPEIQPTTIISRLLQILFNTF